MNKKFSRIVFAVAMLLFPHSGWAYDIRAVSNGTTFYYNITSNTAPYTVVVTSATSNFNSYSGSVTIPSTVTNGGRTYSVTGVGDCAFKLCTGMASVTIPNSVTIIGYEAFQSCTGLTSIAIPNTVTSIGNYAFSGCTNLSSLTIGNSVTSIGYSAFYGCTGLTSVTIPNSVTSIGNSAFSWCTGLTSITIPNSVTSIGNSAFQLCTGLTAINVANGNVNYSSNNGVLFNYAQNTLICCPAGKIGTYSIPNSVTSIGYSAFYGCTGLTSVTIPNSVISIGDYAFYGCTRLPSITIPNAITTIGNSAFSGCSRATSLNLGNSVATIGDGAFQNCTGLDTILFSADSCRYIGNGSSFQGCSNITTLIMGNNVKCVPQRAFSNLTGLTYLTLGDSVRVIGREAFYGCSHLPSVVIPDMVTTLDTGAFYGCSELYSATVGKRVRVIPPQVFGSCPWLTNVTIGEGVNKIDQNAFQNCHRVATLTMKPATPPLIYSQSLSDFGDSIDIYVPCNAMSAYRSAPHWGRFVNYHGEFVNEITCRANNDAWGRVDIIEQPSCTNGGRAQIQAVANSGCRFLRWSDGNTQSLRTLTVTEDTTLIAFFASNQGISEAEDEEDVVFQSSNGQIVLDGLATERVFVADVVGRMLYNATVTGRTSIAVPNSGVYFVKVGTRPARKVVVVK